MLRRSLIARAPLITTAAFLVAVGFGMSFGLISLRLEATGVSGAWIGLNAAMPAVGWIAGAALLPFLQITLRMRFKRLLQLFIGIGLIALVGMRFADGYGAMTALRFGYGGAIGVVFRCVEFWINDVSVNDERGRNIGLYNILFMIAIILGSLLQPMLGIEGWTAFGPPLLLMVSGLLILQVWSGEPAPVIDLSMPPAAFGIAWSIPIAMLAVLAYGLYESVPTTLLQVYGVRNGLDGATAALGLTAAAIGNLVFQYPFAVASDRFGRQAPLFVSASLVALMSSLIPLTLHVPGIFLAAIAVWGGAAGTSYSMALALIGDRFHGAQLVVANAAFGAVYAIGSIVGPVVNGFAIGTLNTHGMMVFLAVAFTLLAIVVAGNSLLMVRRSGR